MVGDQSFAKLLTVGNRPDTAHFTRPAPVLSRTPPSHEDMHHHPASAPPTLDISAEWGCFPNPVLTYILLIPYLLPEGIIMNAIQCCCGWSLMEKLWWWSFNGPGLAVNTQTVAWSAAQYYNLVKFIGVKWSRLGPVVVAPGELFTSRVCLLHTLESDRPGKIPKIFASLILLVEQFSQKA